MSAAPGTAPGASRFDINVGSIMQALILAALLWVGTSVNTLNAQMSAVQVQMVDLADLKKRLAAVELDNVRLASQVAANSARLARLDGAR